MPRGQISKLFEQLRRGEVLGRIGLCLLAALALWVITGVWQPPFSYRSRFVPPRDIVARVAFQEVDEAATQRARAKAGREIVCYYANDARPLEQLEQQLTTKLQKLAKPQLYNDEIDSIWSEFLPRSGEKGALEQFDLRESALQRFREALTGDKEFAGLTRSIQLVFSDLKHHGLLEDLEHNTDQGSLTEIIVHTAGNVAAAHHVSTSEVRVYDVVAKLKTRLDQELLTGQITGEQVAEISPRIASWLQPRLANINAWTLTWNEQATDDARNEAVRKIEPQLKSYSKGDKLDGAKGDKPNGIVGGRPLDEDDLELLALEHRAYVASLGFPQLMAHLVADFGMYIAMCMLCGVYVSFRHPKWLADLRHFTTLLLLTVAAIALGSFAAANQWRAEIIPLLLFGITVTVVYRHELALLFSSVASLILVISIGQGLPQFVVLVVTVSTAILLLGRIRSRTKLLYVGLCAGAVSAATLLGVGILSGQPVIPQVSDPVVFPPPLLIDAFWFFVCSFIASLLMTGLLPFVEKLFDVQTDISLLELGDVAHPLLQELVRRAPGTYNHSINVASIGEAAADAIGANGLLVRVGAYFHDIGKMLKPTYFIENQGQDASRHQSLLPAMSTLVIIAHVKDGAELARKHRLPQSIIDFIEQHHGSTLVEYFYRQASAKQKQNDPDGEEVDESSFRYPGPKPQTKEAGVMMLADASESASRTLVDPTPARIESLVRELAMKRLLDGEFDECGLTLQELHIVETSLVKSLTAVYHSRVKYSDQQTA